MSPTPTAPVDPVTALPPDLAAAWARLRAHLEALGSVVVAFSGGVDSATLLAAALRALGPSRVLALTAVSPSLAPWALADARRLAAELGAPYREVATQELGRPAYRANAGDRCYHCKAELFDAARLVAAAEGLGALCYGAIPEDLGDDRPGMRAAADRGVHAPLLAAGLGKAQVRALARAWGLSVWDTPASACLASRFPVGTAVDAAGLARVARCEGALRDLGLRHLRARFYGSRVRLELGPEELARVQADPPLRAAVEAAARAAGFEQVVIDPDGYRTGGADRPSPTPLVQIR